MRADTTSSEGFVAWTSHESPDKVFERDRSAGTPDWSTAGGRITVASSATGEDHPAMGVHATAGFVVAWHDVANDRIEVQAYDASDTPRGSGVDLADGDFPYGIVDGNTFHLVYERSDDVFYRSCTDITTTDCTDSTNHWSAEVQVDGVGDVAAQPQIIADADGDLFVAYEHDPAGADNNRVKLAKNCGTGWSVVGNVDGGANDEELSIGRGGSAPALGLDVDSSSAERLGVVYVQVDANGDLIGRIATELTSAAGLCPARRTLPDPRRLHALHPRPGPREQRVERLERHVHLEREGAAAARSLGRRRGSARR